MRNVIIVLFFSLVFLGCKKEEKLYSVSQKNLILTSPYNNQKLVNRKYITFKWNQVPKTANYNLIVALDSNFNNIFLNINSNTLSYYNFTTQNSACIYATLFWKVVATDSSGIISASSELNKVYCLSNSEYSPLITSISTELFIKDPFNFIPTLRWEAIENVSEYQIYGSSESGFIDSSGGNHHNLELAKYNNLYGIVVKKNEFTPLIYTIKWVRPLQLLVRAKLTDGTYTKFATAKMDVADPRVGHMGNYQIKITGAINYVGSATFVPYSYGGIYLVLNNENLFFYSLADPPNNAIMPIGEYFYYSGRNISKLKFKEKNDTIFVSGGQDGVHYTAFRPK